MPGWLAGSPREMLSEVGEEKGSEGRGETERQSSVNNQN